MDTKSDDADEVLSRLDCLMRDAVLRARGAVRDLLAAGRSIRPHYDYPSVDTFDSGQPRISHGEGPTDYAGAFTAGPRQAWNVSYDEIPAFGALGDLFLESEALRSRTLLPGMEENEEWRSRMAPIMAALIPIDILDRLMNEVGDSFTEEDFQSAWEPIRNGLVWDQLPVEIVVPLCLTTFELADETVLGDGICLERLSDAEQAARMPKSIWNGAASECVAGAATHAVVIKGYEMPGKVRFTASYGSPRFYPMEAIELTLQALRIATAAPIGFAQIYMRPIGWAWNYEASLPPVIQGSMSRHYPPSFDDYGWLRPAATVSAEEVSVAAHVLLELQSASTPLRLASRRFSSSSLRAADEDAILDLCIALEAALGDRQPSEMTYKLSMRAAAVAAPVGRAEQVATRVKRLYRWRSAIVHGGDVDRARRGFVGDEEAAHGIEIATILIRDILRQLIHDPELRVPARVDARLIGGINPTADEESPYT